jgi:hypothetical protein
MTHCTSFRRQEKCSIWSNENWKGKLEYLRNPVPLPFCSPQIPHKLNWEKIQAGTVKSYKITTYTKPWHGLYFRLVTVHKLQRMQHQACWTCTCTALVAQRMDNKFYMLFAEKCNKPLYIADLSNVNLLIHAKIQNNYFPNIKHSDKH